MSTQQDASQDLYDDIATTRRDVAETVDALAGRLDVKARAQHRAEETKHAVAAKAHDPRTQRTALIGGLAVAAVVGLVLWRRRR